MRKLPFPFASGETVCIALFGTMLLIAGTMNLVERYQLEKERPFKSCPLCGAVEDSITTSQENTEKFLRKIGKWEEAK
jgi:hypothetical protein